MKKKNKKQKQLQSTVNIFIFFESSLAQLMLRMPDLGHIGLTVLVKKIIAYFSGLLEAFLVIS